VLLFLLQQGCLELLKQSLEDTNFVAINDIAPSGTLLTNAIRLHMDAVAEYLVDHGADPNLQNPWSKETALHEAVKNKDDIMVVFLLRHGASGEIRNADSLTPLQLAHKSLEHIQYDLNPFAAKQQVMKVIKTFYSVLFAKEVQA
jgi:ankyrin repeat protein